MGKYLKKFGTHTEYETYIEGENVILPNVSYCDDNKDVHYNPIPPKATVRLTFTVSEPSKERISIAGDLSPLGGSTDADGLSKVETMRVDGVEVDMETAVTKENIVDMYGVVIDGYFYNFTESGQHTIEYILNDMTVNEGICCTIGNFTYQRLPFTSKISNASVEINADEIEGFSFGYSSSIESVTIGNSVTSIGERAFSDCSGLTEVTILDSVTSIGRGAFQKCSSLTSVTIPDSVTSIGDDAFSECFVLTGITIPSGVTSIGDKAFYDCGRLTSITIPIGVTSIGGSAFTFCSSLASITSLATTAPAIESSTFQYITSDGTLTVPSGSSGYDVWMGTGDYYLGKYNWTKVEQ